MVAAVRGERFSEEAAISAAMDEAFAVQVLCHVYNQSYNERKLRCWGSGVSRSIYFKGPLYLDRRGTYTSILPHPQLPADSRPITMTQTAKRQGSPSHRADMDVLSRFFWTIRPVAD